MRGWPLVVGRYPGSDAATSSSLGQCHVISFCSTSLGRSTSVGPGAAGGGDVERLPDRHRDLLGGHDELVVLGARARDADGVALLEGVGADRRGAHLAGDADHRDRVHVGVHQRRDEVRRGRARCDHGDAGAAGDVGVPLGHVAGALLVTHEHVADRRLEQRVVGRQDAAAGQAEHHVDLLHLECLDESLCSRHSGHCGVSWSGGCSCGGVVGGGRSDLCRKTKRPPGLGGRGARGEGGRVR